MVARMLSQLPLPLLPAGAAEIAPGVGLLAGEDGGLVAVHGLAAFAWDAGDVAGRRLAAVQLVRLRAASQGQVAEAFGVDPATIWRWDQALACGGVAGLVPVRRGPKGASKLTPALAARIAGLDAAGQTLRQIAAATGVSTFTVRAALGRVRPGGQAPAAGGEAGQGSGQPARTPAPGRCAPVSRMAATSTARKIRNSRSSTSSSIQAITSPRLFPRLLMHPAKQRRGHLSAALARSPGAGPLHLEPGHLVNATAASAAEANNCRRADLAVVHPRCCHSRSASESPAITTSPNGMER
jgi:transposase